MPARFFLHSCFLVSSLFIAYFWTQSTLLSRYSLQAIAVLTVLYFLNHFYYRLGQYSLGIDGLIFTLVTLLLITQTGNLSSPLFFLLYILLFGLSLFFSPMTTLVFSLAIMAFFSQSIDSFNSLTQVFSLVLMTPLALLFGKEYLLSLQKEDLIKLMENKYEILCQEVKCHEQDTLLWLTLSFKEQVMKIIEDTADLRADIGRLTTTQKEKLETIHESALKLLELGNKLKSKMEG
ncbi:MAG: hypothetical protein Q7S03_04450 [bacterium]|nr:hypothetical protein [bacterium]